MNDNCCKDCTRRTVGCHSTCPDYAEFVRQNEIRKEKIRSAKQQDRPYAITKKMKNTFL